MTLFTLGIGKYVVAQGTNPATGTPCLSIRPLTEKVKPNTVLDPKHLDLEDCLLIIDVKTPEAATALLVIAQAIAFAHGVET